MASVKVHITTPDGSVLESFVVLSGNVREADPHGVAVEQIAASIRDHIEMRFEVEGGDGEDE